MLRHHSRYQQLTLKVKVASVGDPKYIYFYIFGHLDNYFLALIRLLLIVLLLFLLQLLLLLKLFILLQLFLCQVCEIPDSLIAFPYVTCVS